MKLPRAGNRLFREKIKRDGRISRLFASGSQTLAQNSGALNSSSMLVTRSSNRLVKLTVAISAPPRIFKVIDIRDLVNHGILCKTFDASRTTRKIDAASRTIMKDTLSLDVRVLIRSTRTQSELVAPVCRKFPLTSCPRNERFSHGARTWEKQRKKKKSYPAREI